MSIQLFPNSHEYACRLVFEGSITCDHIQELESAIIGALRRYRQFTVDLAAVSEIDLCGLHLLRLLERVGGDGVAVVARSAVVERALRSLPASPGNGLGPCGIDATVAHPA